MLNPQQEGRGHAGSGHATTPVHTRVHACTDTQRCWIHSRRGVDTQGLDMLRPLCTHAYTRTQIHSYVESIPGGARTRRAWTCCYPCAHTRSRVHRCTAMLNPFQEGRGHAGPGHAATPMLSCARLW
eukprot:1162081-Pelagomonas_calceolata.AAC.3